MQHRKNNIIQGDIPVDIIYSRGLCVCVPGGVDNLLLPE